ncbi:site-specific integrase [Bacillus horti]|uniref:Integrase n=1 Tax=Caldalkalibacillus horti TaxID=77523 RepID=A0ABT9VVV8_9BACI|nr:site-specific integrase [Bacillus horti]MDQ0165020.1 integrase [Bacillus horti]
MVSVEPIRSKKQIRAIRLLLRGDSLRNELLFILGINVGLRISDILKLKIKDMAKPDGVVKEYVSIKEQKTGKTKRFYLGKIVKKTAQEYLDSLPELELEHFVFKSRKGVNKAITRHQAYRIINQAAEMIGLVERDAQGRIITGEIGTHTLRKTFGYHAYKKGTDIVLLQDIFNHSSPSMTLRYIGFTEDQKQEVYLSSNLG